MFIYSPDQTPIPSWCCCDGEFGICHMQNGKLVITLESNRQGFVGASERQPGQMTIIKGMEHIQNIFMSFD